MIWPLYCDVLRPETLVNLQPAGTVVWCVGYDRSSGDSMRHLYVNGLENVLNHLGDWPPFRFVFVSSSSVYGQTGGEWVDETSATEPLTEAGRLMLEAEQLLRSRQPQAVILRFAGIYGPGRLLRSEALLKGTPLVGDPDRWLNLIHVDDGAAAVIAAAERAPAGALINVADGNPAQRGDFFACLAELLGAPPPRFASESGPDPANRRIANHRMLELLHLSLAFPSYRTGLAGSLPEHPW
jgi:nucleoside-diphosphate-sugar epimerase